MPIDLQIIRASEFVRLDADELLDFEASRGLLQGLAWACRKRGLGRAMVDLRSLPTPARPHFTLTQLAALVGTFRAAGFTRKQRLAILYEQDIHRGIRNFAFFGKMRGLQVQAFDEFEKAVRWLSADPDDLLPPAGTAIPIVRSEATPSAVRKNLAAGHTASTPPVIERKTNMKTKFRLAGLILFAATIIAVHAQTSAPSSGEAAAPPSAPAQPSEADLEKLVAPIALYPDPLLSILLPASAYPLDIVKAARFIKDTNNISKVDSQPWDTNVKSLAHFPAVINKMNDDIDWTSSLGQAFAENQKGVLNAVQVMRGKAQAAGTLQTTPQQIVVVTNTMIVIQPAQPQVIYVPEYNPTVVYAGPTPGQVAAASIVSFGVGMAVGAIIANNCDWHSGGIYVGPHGGGVVWGGGYHGDVNINRNVNINVNNNNLKVNNNHSGNVGGEQKWQPNAGHASGSVGSSAESRGWNGPSGGSVGSTKNGGGSAFNNTGGGAQTRASSTRGASSRGGGGRSGGFKGRH